MVERQVVDVVAMPLEPGTLCAGGRVKEDDLAEGARRAAANRDHRAVGAPRDRTHEVGQTRQRRRLLPRRHRQPPHLLVAGHGQLPSIGPPGERRHLRQRRRRLRQCRHLPVKRHARGFRVRRAAGHPRAQHRDLIGREVLLGRHLRLGPALDLQDQRALSGSPGPAASRYRRHASDPRGVRAADRLPPLPSCGSAGSWISRMGTTSRAKSGACGAAAGAGACADTTAARPADTEQRDQERRHDGVSARTGTRWT